MDQTPPQNGSDQIPVRALLTIMLVLGLAVSTIWIALERIVDPVLIDPNVPVTTGDPAASPPVAGTPAEDAPPYRAGSLPNLLSFAADRLADGSLPLDDVAMYADIATWMTGAGLHAPTDRGDPALAAWEAELRHLALPASLVERGLDPVWRATYGFDLPQVHQVLVVGQAPDFVFIMRGAWNPAELQNAWVASGYQAVEIDGVTVWTLSPDDTIDLSSQASRPAMGALNNVTLLDDGTLIAAARMSRMGPLLQAASGGPALIDRPEVAAMFAPGSDHERLVSAVISKGSLLERVPDSSSVDPAATPVATPAAQDVFDLIRARAGVSPMPEADLVLIGIYPIGEEGDAGAVELVIAYDSADDAEAAARLIEQRLLIGASDVTGRPFGQRLGGAVVSIGRGGDADSTVRIEATLLLGRDDWIDMLADRDLGFAAWTADQP